MDHEHDMLALTRRGALMLTACVRVTGWQQRLDAFTSDFWNKKEPAEPGPPRRSSNSPRNHPGPKR